MVALAVIGAILLFFVFLLSLKGTLTIVYSGELELSLRVLFVNIKLYPAKKKKYPRSMSKKKAQKRLQKLKKKEDKKREKKKLKKQKKEQEKQAQREGTSEKKKKTPSEILDIIALVAKLLKKVIKKFFGHLRIKLARIRIKVATDDAATTAIAYGAICQGVNVIFPLIDEIKTVKTPQNKDIDVSADFCSDESEIDIKISFSLRVWHLFHVAFAALGEFIKYLFKTFAKKQEENSAEAVGALPQGKRKRKKKKKRPTEKTETK